MKKCFKCSRELPFTEFYKHPSMADGHLGKCKDCTRADTAARVEIKKADPEWVVAEAKRCREKTSLNRDKGSRVKTKKAKLDWAKRNNHKRTAHFAVNNAVRDGRLQKKPCEVCGNPDSEGHHDDYSKPLDVIWLCPKHHGERHVMLNDQKRIRDAKERANKISA